MRSTFSLLYNILILLHISTSNENWFIATNITLNWEPLKTKEPTVFLSLCVTKPISNNCNFNIKTVPNSGMTTLLSSDFDFSASAKQLEIQQNSTGHFIVSSTSNSSISDNASKTLNILQTVVVSTPILGGTLSKYKYKQKLIQNPFNLMINKQIFEENKNETIIAAAFITIENISSFEWIEICSIQLLFSSNISNSIYSSVSSEYVTISNVKGIQLDLDANDSIINYGGPYFLLIGLKNKTTKLWTNYYEINRNNSNINWFHDNTSNYKYLLYDDSKISVDLGEIKFTQYDAVSMKFGVGFELTLSEIYVTMVNKDNNNTFIAQCSKHEYNFYNSFGWKYLPNIQSGMIYNPLMYWTKVAHGFEISSNALSLLDINITKTKTKTKTNSLINIKNHTFYAGVKQNILITNASVNIPTNISLQIEQCINNKCNVFVNTLIQVEYRGKEQSDIEMIFPDTLQSDYKLLTNGLKTYLVSGMDLCVVGENITTRTEIEILPLFSSYIIGDVVRNEIKWNNLLFPPHDKLIELRLLYWNNNEFIGPYNILSFGMIINNGTLNNFQPNLTMNAKHLRINNGNVGIFNLYSNSNHGNINEINITSRVYNLFQAFSINEAINGQVIAKDDNNNKHYRVKGMIANTLINNNMFTFEFNVYLTNITDNISLNITSTSKQYKLNNISSIIYNNSNQCITNITKSDTNITYCPFILTFNDELNDTNDMINDGEYILSISRYKSNANAYDTNYFYINNFNDYENKSYQFLVYSQKNMIVTLDSITNGTINITSYQPKSMSIDGGDFTGMIYVTLENKNNIFIFDCGPQWIETFKSFGWKFIDIKNKNLTNIISGEYVLKLYWSISISNRYELITNGNIVVNVIMDDDDESPSYDIIVVKDESNNIPFRLNKGESYSFSFSSSIAFGSRINIYFQQCVNSTFECIKYFPDDKDRPYTFNFSQNGESELINLPNNKSLKTDLSSNDNSLITFMVMDIELCDEKNIIQTRQNITISGKSKNDSKLKAGAIVGIICAVVLVLGLAAWWLFMRNSSGDGYRTLME